MHDTRAWCASVLLAFITASCGGREATTAADAGSDAGTNGDWTYDGPRSACSTGTPSADEEIPPIELSHALPECTPRCGESKAGYANYGIVWTTDALPRGACEYDGEVCSMVAVRTRVCDGGRETACSSTGYACRCESGSWRCYHGRTGRSACTCGE